MKNYNNYPIFFSEILRLFVSDQDFYKYFIKQGFDPNSWPDCEAKNIAIQFHDVAQTKSVELAKLKFAKLGLADESKEFYFPDNSDAITALFNEYREFGVWSQVARKIAQNPFKAKDIIFEAQQNQVSQERAIVAQEIIEQVVVNHLEKLSKKESIYKIIPDWPILSNAIGGFNDGRISLVVGGSGAGKTTLVLNLALSAIKDMPVLYINMEMITEDIVSRMVQVGAGISSFEWNENPQQTTHVKVSDFASKFYAQKRLLLTSGKSLSSSQIITLIYEHKQKNDIGLVIIDYDQKIKSSIKGEEWQVILKTIEDLEEVAKVTKTHITVLAQGDDNNDPKASKRSVQPCSCVLSFYKDQESGKFLIESKKNRFGPKFKLEVNCDFSRYQVREVGFLKEDQNKQIHGVFYR